MKVEVIRRITHNDKQHEPGETLVLDKQTADILIGLGKVKEVVEPKPAQQDKE